MSQADRYTHLASLTKRADTIDCAYHAAFYLLSADPELYEIACKFTNVDGINFSSMKRATRGLDERTRFVIDIAHNLFSYYSPCKATPFEISRLGYPLMEQVCTAFYIAAGEVKLQIQPDAENNAVIVLDTAPYQKTKCAHRYMEQLQASMLAQDEAGELER